MFLAKKGAASGGFMMVDVSRLEIMCLKHLQQATLKNLPQKHINKKNVNA